MDWINLATIYSKKFKFGYCGSNVASNKGYRSEGTYNTIFICPHCEKPTYFESRLNENGIPGSRYGEEVGKLSPEISNLYNQARISFSVFAYTGVALLCRKIIMNVCVDNGAVEGKKFAE